MAESRWTEAGRPVDDQMRIALTFGGSAFHAVGLKRDRTRCGKTIWSVCRLEATELDYCRRCWGAGRFQRVA